MTDKFENWTLSASNGEVTINGTTDTLDEADKLWVRLSLTCRRARAQKRQLLRMAAVAGLTDLPAHNSDGDSGEPTQ